jgi:hypothetical protein
MFDGQNWVSRTPIIGVSLQYHAGVALDTDRVLICGGNVYNGGSRVPVPLKFVYPNLKLISFS